MKNDWAIKPKLARLALKYDLGAGDGTAMLRARLDELVAAGLVDRV